MKPIRIIATLVLLSLVVVPALGEMTDYQKGAMDGMKAGLRMGKLLGAAPYDPTEAQKYNELVDAFNQGLAALFGNNTEAVQMFWMTPYGSVQGDGYSAINNLSFRPIHAIDASFNQTKKVNPDLLTQGKYFGYDLDSYIAMTGHVPANIPDATWGPWSKDNPYGSLGAGP
jgi:hypothetical protein